MVNNEHAMCVLRLFSCATRLLHEPPCQIQNKDMRVDVFPQGGSHLNTF